MHSCKDFGRSARVLCCHSYCVLQSAGNSFIIIFQGFKEIKLLSGFRMEIKMINFNNNKNKKIVSAVIIILLVLAMVLPMVESLL